MKMARIKRTIGIRDTGKVNAEGLPIQETYNQLASREVMTWNDFPDKTDPVADAQKAIDTLTNLQVDNLRMKMDPPMYVPH